MAAGKYSFTIEQGTKFSRDVAWKNADRTPVNISGYTFRMMAERTTPKERFFTVDEQRGLDLSRPL